MIVDIKSGHIFGNVIAYVYTIEFQKRGLPHCHALFTWDRNSKILTLDSLDCYVKAEILDDNPKLRDLVISYMLHGPRTESLVCLDHQTNNCSKIFPTKLCSEIW